LCLYICVVLFFLFFWGHDPRCSHPSYLLHYNF
jgi:hypothetical protein